MLPITTAIYPGEHIQALLFPKVKYNMNTATKWALDNGYKPIKSHITDKYIRLRLVTPDSSKYDYTTIFMDNPGGYEGDIRPHPHMVKGISGMKKGVFDFVEYNKMARNNSGNLLLPRKGFGIRGGAIGSDLAVGTATVALPLMIYAAKKLYDKVSSWRRGSSVGALMAVRPRTRPMF